MIEIGMCHGVSLPCQIIIPGGACQAGWAHGWVRRKTGLGCPVTHRGGRGQGRVVGRWRRRGGAYRRREGGSKVMPTTKSVWARFSPGISDPLIVMIAAVDMRSNL